MNRGRVPRQARAPKRQRRRGHLPPRPPGMPDEILATETPVRHPGPPVPAFPANPPRELWIMPRSGQPAPFDPAPPLFSEQTYPLEVDPDFGPPQVQDLWEIKWTVPVATVPDVEEEEEEPEPEVKRPKGPRTPYGTGAEATSVRAELDGFKYVNCPIYYQLLSLFGTKMLKSEATSVVYEVREFLKGHGIELPVVTRNTRRMLSLLVKYMWDNREFYLPLLRCVRLREPNGQFLKCRADAVPKGVRHDLKVEVSVPPTWKPSDWFGNVQTAPPAPAPHSPPIGPRTGKRQRAVPVED